MIEMIIGGIAFIFGAIVILGMGLVVWESTKMIEERNEWRRKTGKYHPHE